MSLPAPLARSFPIALGTAGFGTAVPTDLAYQLLDHYVAAGGNHLDTAHDYASWVPGGVGASEKTIGEWLRRSGARQQVILATKIGCTRGGVKHISRVDFQRELALSLERLGVPSVDVLWLHRDDPAVPVDDILQWVHELRREGKFMHAGASNWSSARLDEANRRAQELGVPGFIASQCGWNLAALSPNAFDTGDARFVDATDEAWHQRTQFPLVAWEAQAGGFFSGRYAADRKPTTARGNVVVAHYANAANWSRLAACQAIARARGVTANQVALAWLRQQSFPVIAIIGPGNLEQLQDSLPAAKLTLDVAEVERLRAAS